MATSSDKTSDQPVITPELQAQIDAAKSELPPAPTPQSAAPAAAEAGKPTSHDRVLHSLGTMTIVNQTFAGLFIGAGLMLGIAFFILAGGVSGLQWDGLLLAPLLYAAPVILLINAMYLIEALVLRVSIPKKYYVSLALFAVPPIIGWVAIILA